MVDITEISAIVAAVGVIIGVAYYILDMRNQARIRKTDLLMRLYSTGTNTEFMDAFWKVTSLQVKDYEDYVRQHGSLLTDSPMNRAFLMIATYYELAGILLYRKLIDIVTVYDVWGSSNPRMLFEKIKPVVLGIRREIGEPLALAGFEYLCDELKRNEPQLRKTWKTPSPSSVNSLQRDVSDG
jgi:hypothetical protein